MTDQHNLAMYEKTRSDTFAIANQFPGKGRRIPPLGLHTDSARRLEDISLVACLQIKKDFYLRSCRHDFEVPYREKGSRFEICPPSLTELARVAYFCRSS